MRALGLALLLFSSQAFAAGQWTYTQVDGGRVWSWIELDTAGKAPNIVPSADGSKGEFHWSSKLDTTQGMVDIDMRTEFTAAHLKQTALKTARTLGRLSGTIGTIVTVGELLADYGLLPNGQEATSDAQGFNRIDADTSWKQGTNGTHYCVSQVTTSASVNTALALAQSSISGSQCVVGNATVQGWAGCTTGLISVANGAYTYRFACSGGTIPTLAPTPESDILARHPTTPQSDAEFLAGLPGPAWDYVWDASDDVAAESGGRRTTASGPPAVQRTDTTEGNCPAPYAGQTCTTTTTRRIPITYEQSGENGEAPAGAPSGAPAGAPASRTPHVTYGPQTTETNTRPKAGGPVIDERSTQTPVPVPTTGGGTDTGGGTGTGTGGAPVTPPSMPVCTSEDPVASWEAFVQRLRDAVSVELGALNPECPQPSFEWYGGGSLTLDAHCEIVNRTSPVLRAAMLVFWSLLGGLIVLRA